MSRPQILSGSTALTSVATLLRGIDNIDPTPYDFPAPPDVPGAKRIGTMSLLAGRLHAASMIAFQKEVEASRELERARQYRKVVDALFRQAIAEEFPMIPIIEQVDMGVTTKRSLGIFFGDGWNVYSAPVDELEKLSREARRKYGGCQMGGGIDQVAAMIGEAFAAQS